MQAIYQRLIIPLNNTNIFYLSLTLLLTYVNIFSPKFVIRLVNISFYVSLSDKKESRKGLTLAITELSFVVLL